MSHLETSSTTLVLRPIDRPDGLECPCLVLLLMHLLLAAAKFYFEDF